MWFEGKSCEQGSAGMRKRLESLIGQLIRSPAAWRREPISIVDAVGTVPDPQHPEEPVNSL